MADEGRGERAAGGAVIARIASYLRWDGERTMVSMFVVLRRDQAFTIVADQVGTTADRIERFELEAPDGVFPDGRIVEFDFVFHRTPGDLGDLLHRLLADALERGAVLAWLGFEGSFHFDHLLTRDIATLVYGVADDEGVAVANDEGLEGEAWSERVAAARRCLVLRLRR